MTTLSEAKRRQEETLKLRNRINTIHQRYDILSEALSIVRDMRKGFRRGSKNDVALYELADTIKRVYKEIDEPELVKLVEKQKINKHNQAKTFSKYHKQKRAGFFKRNEEKIRFALITTIVAVVLQNLFILAIL